MPARRCRRRRCSTMLASPSASGASKMAARLQFNDAGWPSQADGQVSLSSREYRLHRPHLNHDRGRVPVTPKWCLDFPFSLHNWLRLLIHWGGLSIIVHYHVALSMVFIRRWPMAQRHCISTTMMLNTASADLNFYPLLPAMSGKAWIELNALEREHCYLA